MQGVQPLLRRYWTWRAISWSERGGRKEKVSKNLEKESEGKGASRSENCRQGAVEEGARLSVIRTLRGSKKTPLRSGQVASYGGVTPTRPTGRASDGNMSNAGDGTDVGTRGAHPQIGA